MTPQTQERLKKILPSRKFARIIGVSSIVLIVFFVASSHFGSTSIFSKGTKAPVSAKGTVGDVVTRDSNKNDIPDWEESLWGLDPKGDGVENARIIREKKIAAGINVDATSDEGTATDQFSQELLSTIIALYQSGSLTPEAVTKLAESVGQSVDGKYTTTPAYTAKDITVSSTATKKNYEDAVGTLLYDYRNKNLGSEADIISQGLNEDTKDALQQLTPISQAYIDLGQRITKLNTPQEAVPYALTLANTSAQAGQSLVKIQKIYSDVLLGMVGLDEYAKADMGFDTAFQQMGNYFSQ